MNLKILFKKILLKSNILSFSFTCKTSLFTTSFTLRKYLLNLPSGLKSTINSVAKGFYAASIAFSSGAVASGGVAVMTGMCQVSEVALLSEVIGGAFLWLGELAHAQALR